MNKLIKADTLLQLMQHSKSWLSNRTGTSADDWKARLKDWTWLPVRNLLLCHWSSQLFDLRAQSSTDVPILLLNQPIVSYQCKSVKSLKTKQITKHMLYIPNRGDKAEIEVSSGFLKEAEMLDLAYNLGLLFLDEQRLWLRVCQNLQIFL